MSGYGHGACGMNNPNCGQGVKGCQSEHEPDPQDFDTEMTDRAISELNWESDKIPSIIVCLQEVVDSVENEAGNYKDWLCDNELLNHIKAVIELCD